MGILTVRGSSRGEILFVISIYLQNITQSAGNKKMIMHESRK